MKKISKFLGILLIIALVMSMGISSAFAASITITHGDNYEDATGTTARVYNAYKVFDASYTSLSGANTEEDVDDFTYTPDDAAVSYSIATDSPWLPVMQAAGQTWFDVTLAGDGSKYIVTPKKDGTTSLYSTTEHAQAFAAYLEENIPATATATEVTVDGGAVTVSDKGYYLIVAKDTKDAATKLAVVTTDVTLVEKNTYITTGKETSETSYNVGDFVTYTATVTIPSDTAISELKEGSTTEYKDGHGPIILHDKMAAELAFVNAAYNADTAPNGYSATVDSAAFSDYTLTTTTTDNCTFEISIPVTSALLGKSITFTYKAEVTSDAATDEGFVNELGGELNGYKTTPDTVNVYTFDFDFTKEFTGSDEELTAKFEVRTDADDADTAIAFIAKPDKTEGTGDDAVTVKVYEKADSDDTGTVTEVTITNGQKIDFVGLKAGDYYLVETETSNGYNLLSEAVKVTITDTTTDPASPSHTVSYEGAGISGTGTIPVVNNSGTVLPSTGGMGTTILYIAGAILVLGAGILLVTKRRMGN